MRSKQKTKHNTYFMSTPWLTGTPMSSDVQLQTFLRLLYLTLLMKSLGKVTVMPKELSFNARRTWGDGAYNLISGISFCRSKSTTTEATILCVANLPHTTPMNPSTLLPLNNVNNKNKILPIQFNFHSINRQPQQTNQSFKRSGCKIY